MISYNKFSQRFQSEYGIESLPHDAWLGALKEVSKERRKTVRKVKQQRKQYICPKCGAPAVRRVDGRSWYCTMNLSCRWVGKRPAVA